MEFFSNFFYLDGGGGTIITYCSDFILLSHHFYLCMLIHVLIPGQTRSCNN